MLAPIVAILVALMLPGLILGGLLMYLAFPPVDLTLCEGCGYNLQHSPGRTCPECGHGNPTIETGRRRLQYRGMFMLGVIICRTMLGLGLLIVGLLAMGMEAAPTLVIPAGSLTRSA